MSTIKTFGFKYEYHYYLLNVFILLFKLLLLLLFGLKFIGSFSLCLYSNPVTRASVNHQNIKRYCVTQSDTLYPVPKYFFCLLTLRTLASLTRKLEKLHQLSYTWKKVSK